MKQIKSKKDITFYLSTEFQARIPVFLVYIFFIFWFYLVAKNYYLDHQVNLHYLFRTLSLRDHPANPLNSGYSKVLGNHISGMLVSLLILFAGYGLSTKLYRLFKITEETSFLENFLFSIGLGLGGIIFFVFGIGVVGLLYKSLIWVFLVIFAIFGLWEIIKQKRLIFTQRNKFTGFEIFWVVILFLTGLIFLIGALSPDTYYDSMVYYLSVPQHWIQNHRIITLPYNHLSHMMFNVSLLYTIGLLVKGEILAKLIHFSLGILTIMIIYVFCKKYLNRQIGLLAATIFYTIPVVGIVSQRAGIELGLAFFETLAIFAFVNWCQSDDRPITPACQVSAGRQSPNHQTTSNKWLIISGIFAGLSMGGKYTSLFSFFGLFFSIIIKSLVFDRQKVTEVLKQILLFGFIVGLIWSPWLIKNIVNTGNPVAPFYSDSIGHLKLPRKAIGGDPTYIWSWKLRNVFLFPWTVTMGQATQEAFPGPIFLFALPLLFLFKNPNKVTKYLLIYFFILYLFFALCIGYLRYFIPSLPVISIIFAVYILRASISQIFKKLFLTVISLTFLGNIYFILLLQKLNQNPLPVVLGLESKEEYLSTQRGGYPNPYYGVINWANLNLPETAKILFIGEARELYAERKTITGWADDYNPLVVFSRSAKNAEELRTKLKEEGVTHILLNVPEARRLAGYDILHWEGEDLKVFLDFWNKYVKEIYKDIADISIPHQGIYSMKKQVPQWWQQYHTDPRNYVYLYEILSPEEAEKPHPVPLNFFLIPELYPGHRWEIIKKYFNFS